MQDTGQYQRRRIKERRPVSGQFVFTLVIVDCQFGLEEGKMKGSTKPQRMDEPFYS